MIQAVKMLASLRWDPKFVSRSLHVAFVVDEMEPGWVFSWDFSSFPLPQIFFHHFTTLISFIFFHFHGWLTGWIKWRACDVGEAIEGLESELWHRWSNGRIGEWPFHHFTYVTTHSQTLLSLYLHHSSFPNPSVASPTSQFILQPFFCFSYVTRSSFNSPGEACMFISFHSPLWWCIRHGRPACLVLTDI